MTVFERLFKVMTRPIMVITVVLLITLCWFYIDQPLAETMAKANLREHLFFLNWLTALGFGLPYFLLFFAAGIYFRYIQCNSVWEARSWFMLLCVVVSNLICGFLKVMLGRARPDLWFQNKLYGFYGWHTKSPFMSFPSGHTTTIMSIALGLSILFPRHWFFFILTGFLVALSRVLLVYHYLSDVLIASYLAFLEIGLLYYLLHKKSWLMPAFKSQRSKPTLRVPVGARHD